MTRPISRPNNDDADQNDDRADATQDRHAEKETLAFNAWVTLNAMLEVGMKVANGNAEEEEFFSRLVRDFNKTQDGVVPVFLALGIDRATGKIQPDKLAIWKSAKGDKATLIGNLNFEPFYSYYRMKSKIEKKKWVGQEKIASIKESYRAAIREVSADHPGAEYNK